MENNNSILNWNDLSQTTICTVPNVQDTTSSVGSWIANTDIHRKNTLSVHGPGADIKINEKSMSDWMSTVEKRLAILVPKTELLEKYESLQQAYDHYKTLEALLYDNK